MKIGELTAEEVLKDWQVVGQKLCGFLLTVVVLV